MTIMELLCKYSIESRLSKEDGATIPVLNIPMMSDERWKELSREKEVAV